MVGYIHYGKIWFGHDVDFHADHRVAFRNHANEDQESSAKRVARLRQAEQCLFHKYDRFESLQARGLFL